MSHNKYMQRNKAIEAMVLLGVTCVFLVATAGAFEPPRPCDAEDEGQVAAEGDETRPGIGDYRLALEPVAGFTTVRHIAPDRFAVPAGTQLTLFQPACPADFVDWDGATELFRFENGSRAVAVLSELGDYTIRVQVVRPNGDAWDSFIQVLVADFVLEDVIVNQVTPDKIRLPLTENATNEETFAYYTLPSIAMCRSIGRDAYRTSVDRAVSFKATKMRPAGLAPLLEWRVDGHGVALGQWFHHAFEDPGTHTVSVGPPSQSKRITVETYHVTITSHATAVDIVPEGEPITFTAVTEPPGFEDEITWLSSTKYGTAKPVLGYGPTFTVQFDDTFGPHPDGGLWQWLGVKADNVVFGQDQKESILPCCVGNVCSLERVDDCIAMGGDWSGEVSSCAEVDCAAPPARVCRYTMTVTIPVTCTDCYCTTGQTYCGVVPCTVVGDCPATFGPVNIECKPGFGTGMCVFNAARLDCPMPPCVGTCLP